MDHDDKLMKRTARALTITALAAAWCIGMAALT
jgi:hypothetical protein